MSPMEHRCSQRLSMELPAIIHRADGRDVPVMIRNVSHGGAFVAVSAGPALLRGLVEVELRAMAGESDALLWRAWVIRQAPDGAGLMFDDRQLPGRVSFLAGYQAA